MSMKSIQRFTAASVLVAIALAAAGCSGKVDNAYEGKPGVVSVRRVTESQYRHTIADVFGEDIAINGRFEPEMREQGLLAIGGSKLSISPSGFEQYFSMASAITDAALREKAPEAPKPRGAPGAAPPAGPAPAAGGPPPAAAMAEAEAEPPKPGPRERTMPCKPADVAKADTACARMTLTKYGRALFRRSLTEAELAPRVAVADKLATESGDFYAGIRQSLVSLLVAPEFLFRVEIAEPVPGNAKQVRLDGSTKAARLSYLFWDTTPDEELLVAAETGKLHTRAGIEKQIKRLAASPRAEAGTRAFFDDMLQNDLFASITKDSQIYPKFSLDVANSAREQTLRTLVDHLLTQKRDYRDIFTTRDTFIDRNLASIYKVPFLGDSGWVAYTAPEDAENAGVLTQTAFLALFSHPGRSSPTKRGVAVHEVYLCEQTPLPPANVDFSIVNDTQNPNLKTVRQRLLAHSLDESCASCHNKSDPIGLALERFDSLGQHRLEENGDVIDATAELDGRKFDGATGMGATLRDNPKVPSCLVRNVFAYGVGRTPTPVDQKYLDAQSKKFAGDKYNYPNLLARIASTPEFFGFDPAATKDADAQVAERPAAETPANEKGGT